MSQGNGNSVTLLQLAKDFISPGYYNDVCARLESLIESRGNELVGNGTNPQNDALWGELDTDRAYLRLAMSNGLEFPFLLGLPYGTERRVVFESFVSGPENGFWMRPNFDTVTIVFAELLQLRNFTFAPAHVVK